jgi:hypothetical protein
MTQTDSLRKRDKKDSLSTFVRLRRWTSLRTSDSKRSQTSARLVIPFASSGAECQRYLFLPPQEAALLPH